MLSRWFWRKVPPRIEQVLLGAPWEIGPTGEASFTLNGRWVSEAVFVQFIAKIDESGTHRDSPFMIMAGYAARLGEWNRFDVKWRKHLAKSHLEHFHSVELPPDHPFYFKGSKIADDNLMFGFVVRLDRKDYQNYYRNGGWGGKAQPDSMYGLCFRYCLSLMLDKGRQEIPRDDLQINFIVEDGHPNCGSACEIVRVLKKKKIPDVSEFFGAAILGDKKKAWGLQAADMLANTAWRVEPLEPPKIDIGQDAPLIELRGLSVQKAPVFYCHINEHELASFKGDYFLHLEYRKQWGIQRTAEVQARKMAAEKS